MLAMVASVSMIIFVFNYFHPLKWNHMKPLFFSARHSAAGSLWKRDVPMLWSGIRWWSRSLAIYVTGSCEWQTSTSSRRSSCLTACCFFWPFPDERLQVAPLTTTCTRRCVDARISVLFWFSYLQHMSSVWTTVPMFGSPKNINNIQQLIQLSRSSIDL